METVPKVVNERIKVLESSIMDEWAAINEIETQSSTRITRGKRMAEEDIVLEKTAQMDIRNRERHVSVMQRELERLKGIRISL